MILTIGMPAHSNEVEVWFTIQALKLYQDLTDTEILVVDNGGTEAVQKVAADCRARYHRYTDVVGTAAPRDEVFRQAKGEFVLAMDSHVMLWPMAVTRLKQWLAENREWANGNLFHGPMATSGHSTFFCDYKPQWRGKQWGIWGKGHKEHELPEDPFEIDMMGMGVFGCRKDAWLGFPAGCSGFGGVEGVIHTKFQRSGKKIYCLPFLKWSHLFVTRKRAWPIRYEDRIRNYEIGFRELGGMEKELAEMRKHFEVPGVGSG